MTYWERRDREDAAKRAAADRGAKVASLRSSADDAEAQGDVVKAQQLRAQADMMEGRG